MTETTSYLFSTLQPGQSLGNNYKIVNFLGSGWEGEVFRVVETSTRIERAAKLFYPKRNLRNKALRHYARKLNKLKDVAAITQYHHMDTAIIEGREIKFMISEYVEGVLMTDLLEAQPKKRFSDFEALALLDAVVQSVVPIHQLKEYHGDLHTSNIIVRRKGVGFKVKLVDLFDLGPPNKSKIQEDVIDIVKILYELVGGQKYYYKTGNEIKQIVRGLKRSLILESFLSAQDLKNAIDTMEWNDK